SSLINTDINTDKNPVNTPTIIYSIPILLWFVVYTQRSSFSPTTPFLEYLYHSLCLCLSRIFGNLNICLCFFFLVTSMVLPLFFTYTTRCAPSTSFFAGSRT